MDTTTKRPLTKEEINAKADELRQKFGVRVFPILFQESDDPNAEQIIGYIKEPKREVKLRVMDKAILSQMTAAAELLEATIIKEESDPRIYGENPENDKFFIGAALAAMDTIKHSINLLKKK